MKNKLSPFFRVHFFLAVACALFFSSHFAIVELYSLSRAYKCASELIFLLFHTHTNIQNIIMIHNVLLYVLSDCALCVRKNVQGNAHATNREYEIETRYSK